MLPQRKRAWNQGCTMDIRPEAETIAAKLPSPHRVFATEKGGQVTEICRALSEADLHPWASYPATALTNAVAAVSRVPSSAKSEVSHAFLRYLEDVTPGTFAAAWERPFLDAVQAATEDCFAEAATAFSRNNLRFGASHLSKAVNCALIGQAATRGWPHATPEDDLNAVVGLLTGTLPRDETEFKSLHDGIPERDLTLSSLYGAVKRITQSLETGDFETAGYNADIATDYARQAVGLISVIGARQA